MSKYNKLFVAVFALLAVYMVATGSAGFQSRTGTVLAAPGDPDRFSCDAIEANNANEGYNSPTERAWYLSDAAKCTDAARAKAGLPSRNRAQPQQSTSGTSAIAVVNGRTSCPLSDAGWALPADPIKTAELFANCSIMGDVEMGPINGPFQAVFAEGTQPLVFCQITCHYKFKFGFSTSNASPDLLDDRMAAANPAKQVTCWTYGQNGLQQVPSFGSQGAGNKCLQQAVTPGASSTADTCYQAFPSIPPGYKANIPAKCNVVGDIWLWNGTQFVRTYDDLAPTGKFTPCPNGCLILAAYSGTNATNRTIDDLNGKEGCGNGCKFSITQAVPANPGAQPAIVGEYTAKTSTGAPPSAGNTNLSANPPAAQQQPAPPAPAAATQQGTCAQAGTKIANPHDERGMPNGKPFVTMRLTGTCYVSGDVMLAELGAFLMHKKDRGKIVKETGGIFCPVECYVAFPYGGEVSNTPIPGAYVQHLPWKNPLTGKPASHEYFNKVGEDFQQLMWLDPTLLFEVDAACRIERDGTLYAWIHDWTGFIHTGSTGWADRQFGLIPDEDWTGCFRFPKTGGS